MAFGAIPQAWTDKIEPRFDRVQSLAHVYCDGQFDDHFFQNHLLDIETERSLSNLVSTLEAKDFGGLSRQEWLEKYFVENILSTDKMRWFWWDQHFVHPVKFIGTLLNADDTEYLNQENTHFSFALKRQYRTFLAKFDNIVGNELPPNQKKLAQFLDGLEFLIAWQHILGQTEHHHRLEELYQFFSDLEQAPLPYRGIVLDKGDPLRLKYWTIDSCITSSDYSYRDLAISPDGKALYFISERGTVRMQVLNEQNLWQSDHKFAASYYAAHSLRLAKDGVLVLTTGPKAVNLMYPQPSQRHGIIRLTEEESNLGSGVISPTNEHIAFLNAGMLVLYQVIRKKVKDGESKGAGNQATYSLKPAKTDKTQRYHLGPTFSPDGSTLVLSTSRNELHFYQTTGEWKLLQSTKLMDIVPHVAPIFYRDKMFLIGNEIQIFEKDAEGIWQKHGRLPILDQQAKPDKLSFHEKWVAYRSSFDSVQVCDLDALDCPHEWQIPGATKLTNPDIQGNFLTVGDRRGRLYLYEFDGSRWHFKQQNDLGTYIEEEPRFFPNGEKILVTTANHQALVFRKR